MNEAIIIAAKYVFVLVVMGAVLAWWRASTDDKQRLVVSTVLAGGIALLLSRIAGHLYYDPRPFVVQHVQPLIPHGTDNGFPSDHALLTMTLTAVIYFFNKKIARVILILTIMVGAARVLAKVHSPLDIAGGWAIGVIGALLGYYIVQGALGWLQDNP